VDPLLIKYTCTRRLSLREEFKASCFDEYQEQRAVRMKAQADIEKRSEEFLQTLGKSLFKLRQIPHSLSSPEEYPGKEYKKAKKRPKKLKK